MAVLFRQLSCIHAGILALAVVVCLPATVAAQAIGGTVRDSSGGVLPGVTVEARSPVLIEQVRTAVTDGSGVYLITGLQSGTYTVTFGLPGFNTVVREGIRLSTGFTANVDAQLVVGAVEETITVTGASPIVDVQNVNQQVAMNRELLDTVPSGKSFQNLGILIPGMVSSGGNTGAGSDVGGQGGQTQFKLGIHGSDPNDQNITVDGMGMESGQNGGADSMAWLADANFSEIVMNYSANSAEIETGGVRVNMIPREGSNQFAGSFTATLSHPSLQGENIDQRLIDLGVAARSANRVSEMWRVSPTFGGPVKRDKLWFHVSHTTNRADSFVNNQFPDSDPGDLDYTPTRHDPKSQTVDDQLMRSTATRWTYQASAKDKIGIYYDRTTQRRAHFFAGGQGGLITEEASIDRGIATNLFQATWTRPATDRLLFEAGFGMFRHSSISANVPTVPSGVIPALLIGSSNGTAMVRGFASWFPRNPGAQDDNQMIETYRASMSYITGTHAFKVGFQLQNRELNFKPVRLVNMRYRNPGYVVSPALRGRIANGAEFFSNSEFIEKDVLPLGVFVQDKWTLDRMTINLGVRFDYFNASYPAGVIEPSQYRLQPFEFAGDTPYGFKDLQPRLGFVYDVSGNGRTALKFSAGRYADQLTNDILDGLTPSDTPSMSRAWRDFNGDGILQGDPLNPLANGEFILNDGNPTFGQPVQTVSVDPAYGKGWGQRKANWEYGASLQHELLPNWGFEVSYFYRRFVNFEALDNANLRPEDFDTFSVTVPSDPRLPNGGGYVISGLRDIKPEALRRAPMNVRTSANAFAGGPKQTWRGFDITSNARLDNLTLRGGISSGSQHLDSCAFEAALPDNAPRGEWCRSKEAWQLRGSLIASYNLPYGIQVAGTVNSQPGPSRAANVSLPQSATDLGRPLSRNLQINVIEPGTQFGERSTLFDLRFTKMFRLGTARLRTMVDLYNAFNNNSPTREDYTLVIGGNDNYLTPGTIMPARLVKIAFQVDF